MTSRPKHDPFAYIRDYYGVPAFKGARVELTHNSKLRLAYIIKADGQYIRVHFDGDAKPYPGNFHPTDGVRYLSMQEAAAKSRARLETEAGAVDIGHRSLGGDRF